MHRFAALAAAAFVVVVPSAVAADFTDPRGDAGAAPDVTTVAVAKAGAAVAFEITVANMDALASDAELFLALDSDPARGDQHGVDFVYSLRQGGAELRTRRWTGSQHAAFASTATGGYQSGVARFVVQAAELGSPATIRFGAVGARGGESDAAPDNGQWSFRLREVVRIRSLDARFAPARPAAGRALRVTGATARLSDGTRRAARATCEARLARAKLGGSRCSWRLPVSARGKALAVTVRVRVAGVGASARVYRFRVR